MAKRKGRRRKSKHYGWLFMLALLCVLAYAVYKVRSNERSQFISGMIAKPEGFHSYGIDISHYQGEIDWDTFLREADTLIQFMYVKVTEGTNLVDSRWKKNQKSLRETTIPFGGYHFYITSTDPLKQAKHFLKHYMPETKDLPPVLDVEDPSMKGEFEIADIKKWLNHVETQTGKRPVIYTSYFLYRTMLRDAFQNHKFWIANYSYRPERVADEQIIHWQFTDQATFPGIAGKVDLNLSKIEFD